MATDQITLDEQYVERVLQRIRQRFPGWNGFDFPPFVEAEVAFKQEIVAKAREVLGKESLEELLKRGAFDEMLERIKKIGSNSRNMLWRGVPRSGDLNILTAIDGLEADFCRAFFDLLYGDGDSRDRLARYLAFVQEHDLPNKWTFPTYFLFIIYPENEFFIKPAATRKFLQLIDQPARYTKTPSAAGYQAIKAVAEALRGALAEYQPRDMVDIQGLIWAVSRLPEDDTLPLAQPFAALFADWDEANWALDFLRDTLERLGINSPDDERVALTLPGGRPLMHLNFGNWLVLEFVSNSVASVTLPENELLFGHTNPLSTFAQKKNEELHAIYSNIPIEDLREMSPELAALYERSMENIAARFDGWQKSPFRRAHQPELMAALYDASVRKKVLAEGVTRQTPPEQADGDGYFSAETFELLAALHEAPYKTTYQARQEDYKQFVEQPLQQLMKDVVAILPPEITDVMETEKRLFSRILKDDYGRGGAWPHYWGALYDKRHKSRRNSPQLLMSIKHQWLECGFSIGEHDTDDLRRTFQENCAQHFSTLLSLLADSLGEARLVAGKPELIQINADGTLSDENGTWQEWLQDPAKYSFSLKVYLPISEVLAYSKPALRDFVVQTYTQLFPLILLATHDDPLPAIKKYLQIEEEDDPRPLNPELSLEAIAGQTGFELAELQRWVRAIQRKKQAVFYGPPGTGKTYVAERLAKHLVGGGDGFVELVQFHPAYAYEDFMQGIRPESHDGTLSYALKPGRFLEFCSKARERDGLCVLIIDEINRANLSRVFGELMYLLEYRDQSIPLAGGRRFSIPGNVRIIGTMNTADRSIALVDHALRRRFAFLPLHPNFDVLRRYHERESSGFPVEALITQLQQLNSQIADPHYAVGISFFLRPALEHDLADIWQMEIEPYLEEYFFDRPDTVNDFRWQTVRRSLNL